MGAGEKTIGIVDSIPTTRRVAVLMLATRFPRYLGDIGNPDTLPCQMQHVVMPSATVQAVIHGQPAGAEHHQHESAEHPLVAELIKTAQLVANTWQPDVITTSCGFLYPCQQQLTMSVPVPVLSSALLWLERFKGRVDDARIAIMTFDKQALLMQCLSADSSYAVVGVPAGSHFHDVIANDRQESDVARLEADVRAMANQIAAHHPQHVVLECTNLRPFRHVIEDVLHVPVHDLIDLLAIELA